jgi:hypothetical protein
LLGKVDDLRKLIVQAASRQSPGSEPEFLTDFDDVSPSVPTMEPDPSVDLDDYRQEHEIATLRQQLREAIETHDNRITYIGRVFGLVIAWLACVVLCVALSGFTAWGFKLSDQVLIAFITSTTINVVGLFVVVAKWLYPSSGAGAAKKPPAKMHGAGKKNPEKTKRAP